MSIPLCQYCRFSGALGDAEKMKKGPYTGKTVVCITQDVFDPTKREEDVFDASKVTNMLCFGNQQQTTCRCKTITSVCLSSPGLMDEMARQYRKDGEK